MAPKVRITKEGIISAALEIARTNGVQSINARTIAAELGCSTQPIFSNFAAMDELQCAVREAAYARYLNVLQSEAESGEYPPYKAYGMAYIRFAKEERELFKLLFMSDYNKENVSYSADFKMSVEMIAKANNADQKTAELMHLEMWMCVHGIATMFATSFLNLEEELVSQILSDVYQGLCAKHFEREKKQ